MPVAREQDQPAVSRRTIADLARELAVAALLTGLALLALGTLVGQQDVTRSLLVLAVGLSGAYGGLAPGLFAAALACAGAVLLTAPSGRDEVFRIAVFSATLAVVAIAGGELRRQLRRTILRWNRAERRARKLAESQAFTVHLATAHERGDVDRAILEIGLPALGAAAAVVTRVGRGELEVVDVLGFPTDVLLRGARIPLEARSPLSDTVRTREPLWIESAEEVARRYPGFAATLSPVGAGALAVIPIAVAGACTGAIALTFSSERSFGEEERSSIVSLVTTAGRVFERAGLQEEVASERARAELLASMAADLGRGIDLESVIRTALIGAARLLGGDDGAVYLFEPDGKHLCAIAEVRPEQRTGNVVELGRLPAARRALDAGRARFFARSSATGADAEWFDRYELMGTIVAPLLQGERRLGVLYVNYLGLSAPHPDEVVFADGIAAQCALAISRAQAFEKERAERARATAAEEEAKQTARVQEQLMGVVGHDLRTPLSAIMIGAGLMARRGGLGPDQQRTLSRIHQSAYRATHIIRDLLEYSRHRSGQALPIQKQPVRVADACERAVLEHRTIRRDVEISLFQHGDTTLEADAARIAQVASNLIGNAIQHGQGAPVDVTVQGRPDEVIVGVHNRGPSIPPDVLPRIFEPFQRNSSDTAGARAGSVGLGLYIVREIVAAHGGHVEVESSLERGTTFTVRLPRPAAATASATPG